MREGMHEAPPLSEAELKADALKVVERLIDRVEALPDSDQRRFIEDAIVVIGMATGVDSEDIRKDVETRLGEADTSETSYGS